MSNPINLFELIILLKLLLFRNVQHSGASVNRFSVSSVPRATVPTLKPKKPKNPKNLKN